MRPLDPRLLREVSAARRYVGVTAGLGALTAGLVAGQAVLLAGIVTAAVGGGRDLTGPLLDPLAALAGVVLARAGVAAAQERCGARAATAVVGGLRRRLVAHVAALRVPVQDPVATATLATQGLRGLEGYLTKYLPQLLLACTVTPGVLLVVWCYDTVAGLTVTLTLPLVPLFMALVGLSTQRTADRALRSLQRLGAQLLDLAAGLPTLRAHGREAAQAVRVREVGDAHRRLTMRTLRSAFLSSLVLETMTTLSVALVAVGVGLRLVAGGLDLRTGLTVLVLAPEVYLPLRMVGVHYHASVDGLAAAGQALDLLDRPVPPSGTAPAPDLRTATLEVRGLSVVHPGADRATPGDLSFVLRPGAVVALTGPSGCGKSSAVRVLLGLARPAPGTVTVRPLDGAPVDLVEVDPAAWARQLVWVPQRPTLVPDTVRANVLLTSPDADAAGLAAAARATGFDTVVARLPAGWDTRVGTGGAGLSAGQRQLLALTRALLSDAPLVVLDEPTAHLDAASEAVVLATIDALRAAGRTVLVVAHRPALASAADVVVEVRTTTLSDDRGEVWDQGVGDDARAAVAA